MRPMLEVVNLWQEPFLVLLMDVSSPYMAGGDADTDADADGGDGGGDGDGGAGVTVYC